VLVIVLVLWHFTVAAFDLPAYLVPSPGAVRETFVTNAATLAMATLISGLAALCGFLISLILGVAIAVLFSQSALIRRGFYPYAIFLQTVPIVAIAPLIINWFDPGFRAVLVVVAIISLFPIVASTTVGLTSISASLVDLFRLHRATRWQRLRKLQLPHAVPSLINGARTSSGLAVVGAIVGEFFAGFGVSQPGLGNLITQASSQLKTDLLFATMILSAILGVIIFGGVSFVGSCFLRRWLGGTVDPNA
jgi:NitT/TauT family transport system permease protein